MGVCNYRDLGGVRLSVRLIGAFSFSVHVGVPSVRVQLNERPWYSVSAWIARRFARFFFGFFDFFVFLGLFSPSARCFLFPYPEGVILGLGKILAMLN